MLATLCLFFGVSSSKSSPTFRPFTRSTKLVRTDSVTSKSSSASGSDGRNTPHRISKQTSLNEDLLEHSGPWWEIPDPFQESPSKQFTPGVFGMELGTSAIYIFVSPDRKANTRSLNGYCHKFYPVITGGTNESWDVELRPWAPPKSEQSRNLYKFILPLVGREPNDPIVQLYTKSWPHQVKIIGKGVRIRWSFLTISPQDLLEAVIVKVREHLGKSGITLQEPILLLPPELEKISKQCIGKAVEKAGFSKARILSMPFAATLAFVPTDYKQRIFLVVGSRRRDVKVSVLEEKDGKMSVKSTETESNVSGNYCDNLILQYYYGVCQTSGGESASKILCGRCREGNLLRKCQEAKKMLSFQELTYICLDSCDECKSSKLKEVKLTRSAFEYLIAVGVEKTVGCVVRALKAADISADTIDEVMLVGGSTKIPLVRRRIAEVSGGAHKMRSGMDPAYIPVIGAASYHGETRDDSEISGIDVLNLVLLR